MARSIFLHCGQLQRRILQWYLLVKRWQAVSGLCVPGSTEIGQNTTGGKLTVDRKDGNIFVSGAATSISFSESDGFMHSWISGEQEMIKSPLVPNFWRPLTDNDIPNGHLERCGVWRTAPDSLRLVKFACDETESGAVRVRASYEIRHLDVTVDLEYKVASDNSVKVDMRFVPGCRPLPELPRLGMTMALQGGYDNMKWYGRGTSRKLSRTASLPLL